MILWSLWFQWSHSFRLLPTIQSNQTTLSNHFLPSILLSPCFQFRR